MSPEGAMLEAKQSARALETALATRLWQIRAEQGRLATEAASVRGALTRLRTGTPALVVEAELAAEARR